MDPSRGDSRYNLNYSMSSIGLSLADQADMYGNPAAVAALGRPPSAGLLQSMGAGGGVGLASRSAGSLMSNPSQCQSLSNNSGSHGSGQQRGIKRSGSDCYDDTHHRVPSSGGSALSNIQGLDNCGGASSNVSHGGGAAGNQQPHSSGAGGNVADVIDDNYNSLQSKKSPPANGKKTKGRVKIKMEYIDNKLRRYTTFSKRKTGIMKKAYELSTLTGTQVMLLVASETGHVYTFATRKLQPMITSEAGKQLIQTCLNSPDPPSVGGGDQRMSATGFEETELSYNIADEDSKEVRSPLSSINDTDDSSDVDGVGALTHEEAEGNVDKGISTVDCNWETGQKYNPKVSIKQKSQGDSVVEIPDHKIKAQNTCQPNVADNRHRPNSRDGLTCQPSVLPNVTQDVLLQLIESGHLQVHTEEDGSGHQYVAIPLPTSTADLIHSRKAPCEVSQKSSENPRRVLSTLTSSMTKIKEEIE
ncbi:serum response factor homolog isoform X1 [Stomoxys calcitrans]|uniref:serum response factor homolog isoform X1 n=1 Tax=Stomoxys calcitrans TaxID=35570 RepID=UPI0027E261C9|nr:serum response factor homolog isoform X1 [Stomoxys calcitrans]